MKQKKKSRVLIVQEVVPLYRIPLFKGLSEIFDITLGYRGECQDFHNDLKKMKINIPTPGEWKEMDMLEFDREINQIIDVFRNFDITIIPLVPHRKALYVIERIRRYTKVIVWGIGVAASYDTRYDSVQCMSPSFESIISMSDAAIFYSDYPRSKYIKNGLPPWKMFVANNTVEVIEVGNINHSSNKYFLFVGSLLHQKRIDLLLEAYKKAYEICPGLLPLRIIGDGEEYDFIMNWINQNSLNGKIELKGAIYEEDKLKEEYSSACLSLSSDQAGLSVLKSMG